MTVDMKWTSDDSDVRKALAHVHRQMEKLQQQNRKLAAESKKASQEGTDGMAAMGRKVLAVAAAYGSVSGAIRLSTQSLELMNQTTGRAEESMGRLADARRRLVQVSTDEADLGGLSGRAEQLARRFGVDRAVASNVLFAARSENFEPFASDILRFRGVVDPATQASIAGQVPQLFTKSKISPREAVNMSLAAAADSRLSVEQLGEGLPRVAEGADIAGAGPAEAFAIASVLAGRFASGKTSADRIKAFGVRSGISEKFGGEGIVAAVKKLQAATPEERRKFLGDSQELNVAFNVLSQELPQIEARTAELKAVRATSGTPDSPLERGLRRAKSSGILRGDQRVERARAAGEQGVESAVGDDAGLAEARDSAIDIIEAVEQRDSYVDPHFPFDPVRFGMRFAPSP